MQLKPNRKNGFNCVTYSIVMLQLYTYILDIYNIVT